MQRKRALLMIGYLGPGGAERQIGYLAAGMAESGWDVGLAAFSLHGDGDHFAADLRQRGIPLHALDHDAPIFRPAGQWLRLGRAAALLRKLPEEIQTEVAKVMVLFLHKKPHLVVCYLDRVNIVCGLAAMLAGVPRILLSGRNLNPTCLPYLDRPWFHDLYRLLLACPAVTLKANSHAGASSYEQWLGMPSGSVPVVHNGLTESALPPPDDTQVKALRAELGVAEGAPLVLGVFRLSPEKRPELFFDLVDRLRLDFPNLTAAIAGLGNSFAEYSDELVRRGSAGHIHLLGRRQDMPALFQAADLMLHVSAAEGVPNAVMEAQWLGCPVVGTLGGGTVEILAQAQKPYFHGLDEHEAVLESCRTLLRDRTLCGRIGSEASTETRARFSVRELVRQTLDVAAGPSPFNLPAPVLPRVSPAALSHATVLWLRLMRPRRRMRKILRRFGKRPFTGTATTITHNAGLCYLTPIPPNVPSDETGLSPLWLFEDGRPLGPAHTVHDDIRRLGGGRYSHWGCWLYFSASDGSDPRTNGRLYSFAEIESDDDTFSLV